MPITGINWISDAGHDIHMLRGSQHDPLSDLLEFTLPDGSTEDVITYIGTHHDVEIDFQSSFRNVIDVSTVPQTCIGFGVTINFQTGSIRVDPPPPNPLIHNFLIHVNAADTSDGNEYRTSVRVHLHNRVVSAWLTPPILTVRPQSGTLPETTRVRFSIRALFDDGTVGDLTNHPDIVWRGANVDRDGFLIIAAGNDPTTDPVKVEAVLPRDLRDPADPAAPESVAAGHVRFARAWNLENKIDTEVVQIQDTWPGSINPDLVPNFLFLCDGYKTEDKPRFEASVRSMLSLMKKSRITRPFDLLSTSMNYYQAFMPSNHHGISVLCEVYPDQKKDGTIKLDGRGVADFYCVPNPEDPDAGKDWELKNVIFRLGLPVPGQGLERTVKQTRDYWDSILDAVPHGRISNSTVRAWQKLARRTFLEETDSIFGLAYGNYPAVSTESDDKEIGFHPRRMTRARLDPVLNRLEDTHGNSLGPIWMERANGTRPTSYPLIFILSSLKWDRGVNFGRSYIAMNVEERRTIPARAVAGKPTYEIDLTGKITGKITHDRLVRGCHEVAHSFGLGDEYSEKGTMPDSTEVDRFYGNLQKHSDLLHPVSNAVDGDMIKWRWHRVRKAAVIVGAIAEVPTQPGKFRIPVILGQARQFAVGNTVLLRFRQYPNPLPRFMGASANLVSDQLEVVDIADPSGILDPNRPRGPDNPLIGVLFVSAKAGHAFSNSDAARFPAGCIVYLPVAAPESVHSSSYPFAELVAKNIRDHITDRERALNMDPDSDKICVSDDDEIQKPVKLKVDLPICFSHKNQIVGLFTGGKTFECGVYHPTGSCIMRNSNSNGKEFCAVCRYLLVDIIDPSKHFSIDLDYQEIYPQK
jgi:hypothetical protein